MTFGDYSYGVDGEESEEETDIVMLPDEHPASVTQCDHPNCTESTPNHGQRICDDCTEIMARNADDTCEYCGASVQT